MSSTTPERDTPRVTTPRQLADVDLFGPGAPEHWYEAYDFLHAEAPVHRIPGEGFEPGTDAFILSKHEDLARVVRDEARFPAAGTIFVRQFIEAGGDPFERPELSTFLASMINLRPTPELWRSHRQELTDPWVGPGANRHAPMVTEIAEELVGHWDTSAPIDFVAEFAQPLPQMVMARVLGWPLEDLKLIKYYGDATVKPYVYGKRHNGVLDEEQTASMAAILAEFRQYVAELIARKRAEPADDMITFLTNVEYSPLGRKLTDNEINGIVYAMIIGGLETTQYALAEQVQLLIEHPQVWDELKADRGKLRLFLEEAMRLRAPTQGLSTRVTTQDEEFQGVKVPKGSYLHMRWAAANLDPDEWEEPKTLRLDRKAGSRHLTFSQGARVCPGATLSRVEQMGAWSVLLDRVKSVRYAEGNSFLHQPGMMLGILELHLHVELEA
ncbi:MAG: cytochrome P450 [Pseudomonadota bacterium]